MVDDRPAGGRDKWWVGIGRTADLIQIATFVVPVLGAAAAIAGVLLWGSAEKVAGMPSPASTGPTTGAISSMTTTTAEAAALSTTSSKPSSQYTLAVDRTLLTMASPNSTCQRTFADLDTQTVEVNAERLRPQHDLEYWHCSPVGLGKQKAKYFGRASPDAPPATPEECERLARSNAVAGSIELDALTVGDSFCLVTDAANVAFLKLRGKPGPEYPGPDLQFDLTLWTRS
jgi:hypothetical protein